MGEAFEAGSVHTLKVFRERDLWKRGEVMRRDWGESSEGSEVGGIIARYVSLR